QYYRGGSKENFKRMLNYRRREIDGKIFFVDPVKPPVEPPGNCFYHVNTDKIFKDYASYLAYYKKAKLYKPGAARVCYATGTKVGAANRGHVDDIIRSLEKAGFNVFPISGWDKYEEFVRAVKPDLLVARTGMGTHLELYKELNIPVFCPLNVSRPYDEWLKDQRGFAGGHLTWHIVWPEMDGRIVPYALTAQFPDKYGFHTYKVLPERLENWTQLVKKYINLRKKPNSEKKLVIIYYKGPGENALSAGGLEVGESLFNVLKNLKKAGYKVDGLPENADKLLETIQKYGKVLGAYAKGAISDFLKNGKPELVAAEDYASWAKAAMPADLYEDLIKRYGEPPGEYFSVKKNGKKYLAISRVRFGNVVIMPLPMAGTGSDTSKIVHGAKTAPPHAYIGVYLWARFGFKADALVHFGTHGSVEFTPWKQNALSSYDWPDILMGSIPHSYIYIINNIGEAVLAKRRSYATMVSHLTAPFMKADIYGDLQILHKKIEEYETVEEPQLKAAYNRTICKLIRKLNLEKDLSLPEVKCPLPDEHMEKVHNYLHELSAAKVNRGLYVLDRPYTGEEASETALMMTNDPVARAFADLEHIKGKISGKQLDDLHFFQKNYLKKANTIINTILEKNAAPESFIDPADLRRLKKSKESRTPSNAMNMMNMAKMARRMRQAGTKSGTGMRRRMTMQACTGERKAGPEQIEELLLATVEYPERIVFIRSLSDRKKLENALAMTNPRNRMKERMLARNQPERRCFLAIVSDKNVLALLEIMKDPAHRKSVFDKLADPGFRKKMRMIEKKAMQRRAADMKMKIAGLQKRRALLEKTDIRDPEAMRKHLDELKELAADCELAFGKRNLIADAGKIEDMLRKTKTATTKLEKKYKAYLNSVKVLYEALSSVKKYKADLLYSRKSEILSFLNSL
ncbi:MAG: cobaltochelatase subunit CobN, partial [Victivallales bacterium]|nr:cobaltochelatase subunit CobN [Victivallales bacterium]